MSGKVLDESALDAYANGHLGMATWYALAWELGLTFVVPRFARDEALCLRPGLVAEVDLLLAAPYVVLTDSPAEAARLLDETSAASVYDPLAASVAALCRERGWPALSTDPERLRRVDPSLEVDLL